VKQDQKVQLESKGLQEALALMGKPARQVLKVQQALMDQLVPKVSLDQMATLVLLEKQVLLDQPEKSG